MYLIPMINHWQLRWQSQRKPNWGWNQHAAVVVPPGPHAVALVGSGASSSADGDMNPVMAGFMAYLQQQNVNTHAAMAQQHQQHSEMQALMTNQGDQHQQLHAEQISLTRQMMKDSQRMIDKQLVCLQSLASNRQTQSRQSGYFAHTHIYIYIYISYMYSCI